MRSLALLALAAGCAVAAEPVDLPSDDAGAVTAPDALSHAPPDVVDAEPAPATGGASAGQGGAAGAPAPVAPLDAGASGGAGGTPPAGDAGAAGAPPMPEPPAGACEGASSCAPRPAFSVCRCSIAAALCDHPPGCWRYSVGPYGGGFAEPVSRLCFLAWTPDCEAADQAVNAYCCD